MDGQVYNLLIYDYINMILLDLNELAGDLAAWPAASDLVDDLAGSGR